MEYVTPYVDAIKDIKKKYYLTPFLLLLYVVYSMQIWQVMTRFIGSEDKDLFMFIFTFIQVFLVVFLQLFFYPHASFFIQSTRLYQMVFGTIGGVLKSGFFNYVNIGNSIPDDFNLRSSNGRNYRVSSGTKSKFERVRDARTSYGLYFYFKLIFKDFLLRLLVHMGIFIISPILFLIAIPVLNKNGKLRHIEKSTSSY